MSVLLPLTLHLAVALGIYALAGSLGLLLMPAERKARLWEEMTDAPGLLFGYGALAFAVGAAWIMAHQEWITPLGTIVSIAGWIIAVEGVLLLAVPALMVRLMLAMRPLTVPLCIVGIVIGALLIMAGLTGIANAVPDYMTTPV
ncbi:MAG: DUF2065 domain-containing protein [Sphingobium sp.]|nr:DUF2065 domain-containing protein [Sphingobium sp.]